MHVILIAFNFFPSLSLFAKSIDKRISSFVVVYFLLLLFMYAFRLFNVVDFAVRKIWCRNNVNILKMGYIFRVDFSCYRFLFMLRHVITWNQYIWINFLPANEMGKLFIYAEIDFVFMLFLIIYYLLASSFFFLSFYVFVLFRSVAFEIYMYWWRLFLWLRLTVP